MDKIDLLIDKLQSETKRIVKNSNDVDSINSILYIAVRIIEESYKEGYKDGQNINHKS